MQRLIARAGPLLAAVALGCTSSVKWEASCGCVPYWFIFAQETQFPAPNGLDSVTPESVRNWFVERANGRPYTLESLRSIGWLSNRVCTQHRMHDSLRCVYWLWSSADEKAQRGIEVTFTSTDGISADKIVARYVVDNGES